MQCKVPLKSGPLPLLREFNQTLAKEQKQLLFSRGLQIAPRCGKDPSFPNSKSLPPNYGWLQRLVEDKYDTKGPSFCSWDLCSVPATLPTLTSCDSWGIGCGRHALWPGTGEVEAWPWGSLVKCCSWRNLGSNFGKKRLKGLKVEHLWTQVFSLKL